MFNTIQTRIYNAVKGSKIVNDASAQEIHTALNPVISKAYVETVTKQPDQAVYNELLQELTYFIKDRLLNLRLNEITLAVSNGLIKEYGEYYGLNRPAFVMFFKAYYMCQDRQKVFRQLMAEQEKTAAAVPENIKLWRKLTSDTMQVFAYFKANDFVALTAGIMVYKHLKDIGLIRLPKERVQAIYNKAFDEYIKSKETEMVGGGLFVNEKVKREYEELLAAKDSTKSLAERENAAIIDRAKAISVGEFFKRVVAENWDLGMELERLRDGWIAKNSTPKTSEAA